MGGKCNRLRPITVAVTDEQVAVSIRLDPDASLFGEVANIGVDGFFVIGRGREGQDFRDELLKRSVHKAFPGDSLEAN